MAEPADPREAPSGHDRAAEPAIAEDYERLLTLERHRRRKRDKLEGLLPTIADALDVRVASERSSAIWC